MYYGLLTKRRNYSKIKVVAMDPKTPANLDPKLKEVYDRVMGSANPAASLPPQTKTQSPLTPPPIPPMHAEPAAPLSPSPLTTGAPTKPLENNNQQLGTAMPSLANAMPGRSL